MPCSPDCNLFVLTISCPQLHSLVCRGLWHVFLVTWRVSIIITDMFHAYGIFFFLIILCGAAFLVQTLSVRICSSFCLQMHTRRSSSWLRNSSLPLFTAIPCGGDMRLSCVSRIDGSIGFVLSVLHNPKCDFAIRNPYSSNGVSSRNESSTNF